MRIVSVVGARPQFVKLAPIVHACAAAGIDHKIIHTGQHYDPMLSDVFFRDLGIPAPDVNLGIGSGTPGVQTGGIMEKLDDAFPSLEPDCILVYGDTNSTLAAAVCAVKLHYPLVHLEAGLRSFNRQMPEEHNRVLTDHAADLLLAPTQVAADHLKNEGLADRTVIVGDVMTDVVYQVKQTLDGVTSPIVREGIAAAGNYSLATIHRAENTDDPDRLRSIVFSLSQVDHPVVLLVHPRFRAKCSEFGIDPHQGNIVVHDPLAYPDLISSAMAARGIITDSGGLQKEAFLLRVPTTTIRPETEWVETVECGWNQLVEPGEGLIEAVSRPRPMDTDAQPYGDGHAAVRAVETIAARLS
ncbi:UDP-N-acetylglucosamine 2-epimerase (non-hydrolyzing) [Schaalia sp. ZJ405]|uniref:non-hydrolyzing UDP-N-acetylglucosamine 2-epimerase n=1 Tax=Schaalia sp. ZJ405 TaxID=2709403 RepID=UPI0013EBC4A9|nr:UDP-N-acetylglucosamine 2-epimerase (non-hydrolyzing) [Schaalia sp. ZJ405]QPK81689.1 UDP-N-acetylglucosamine 2-epimerase (non-hydrolyzing) [Schaalia sp. ZJ405]